MTDGASEEHITIRELQRNAAEVFDQASHGQTFVVTRRGETVGRIIPPDPAEEAIEDAIAHGILDPAILDTLPSTAEVRSMEREPSPPGTRIATDALEDLRDAEGDKLWSSCTWILRPRQAVQGRARVGGARGLAGRTCARSANHEPPDPLGASTGIAPLRRPRRCACSRGSLAESLRPCRAARGRVDNAGLLAPGTEVRSLDAIHVAAALALGPALSYFVAYDKRLLDAASGHGLTVAAPS